MTYVKAATSPRARKYLATVEGRRRLVSAYLSGKPRGFVEFTNAEDNARAAIAALEGHELRGQALKVNEGKRRKESPDPIPGAKK